MTLSFGSVCSGIEAASVAWEMLGFRVAWLSEIEPFPCAVLAHHYPSVANFGDMNGLTALIKSGLAEAPDLLVGGTPCQSFSVAGLRKGLSDDRGNLTLTYMGLLNAIDEEHGKAGREPAIAVWENVPGVLSSKDNAFGCFLAGLAGESEPLQPAGQKWTNAGCVFGPQRTIAWRILDAQYFGVAQRRRRVFVVASARDGFDPAEVLFESDGVRRDFAPSREAGQKIAADTGAGLADSSRGQDPVAAAYRMVAFGEYSDDDTASAMKAGDYKDATDLAVYGLTTEQTPKYSKERALTLTKQSPSGGGQPQCVAYPLNTQIVTRGGAMGRGTGFGMGALNDPSYTLQAGHSHAVAHVDVMPTMVSGGSTTASHGQMSGQFREGYITPTAGMQVRRLTPTECERLQGFPDGYTAIPWRGKPANDCPDGPRYKALGNSMAVPVMRWIGARILTQLLTNQRGADHGTR